MTKAEWSNSEIVTALGTMAIVAWLVLFPQHVLFASNTLYMNPLPAALVVLASALLWMISTMLFSAPAERSDGGQFSPIPGRRGIALLCGAASVVAGIVLLCSPGGVASIAAFCLSAFFSMPLFLFWQSACARLSLRKSMLIIGGSLLFSAVVHFLARCAVFGVGTLGNAAVFSAVGLALYSLLPLVSAIFYVFYRPPGPVSDGTEREDVHGGKLMRGPGVVVFASLFCLVCLTILFFAGFTTQPYLFDTMQLADKSHAGLAVVGLAICALALVRRLTPGSLLMVTSSLVFLLALCDLLVFVVVGYDGSDASLVLMQAASCGLVCTGWLFSCLPWEKRKLAWVGPLLGLTVYVSFISVRAFGLLCKFKTGLGTETVTLLVLIALIVLLLAFFVAMIVSNVSSQRALQQASEAMDSAGDREGGAETALDRLENAYRDYLGQFGLTVREAEIAVFLAEGKTLQEASELAGISVNTVRYHAKNIYTKMGVMGKQELRQQVEIHVFS